MKRSNENFITVRQNTEKEPRENNGTTGFLPGFLMVWSCKDDIATQQIVENLFIYLSLSR